MTKLSAVIITFNEEKNIGRCLASLKDIADEIVVMDSFSTDATVEICKHYGAAVFQQKWKGYGAQKNAANAHAANTFILSIDADEELSEELKKSIRDEKEKGLSGIYELKRMSSFCGTFIKHGSWGRDAKQRIFDKTKVKWNHRSVHEGLEFTEEIKSKRLEGSLHHYTCDNLGEYIATINKYTTLGAEVYHEKGKKSSIFHILFKPCFAFVSNYFFQLGFLDGRAGFILARIIAFDTFMKYSKLYYFNKKETAAS